MFEQIGNVYAIVLNLIVFSTLITLPWAVIKMHGDKTLEMQSCVRKKP